MREKIRDWVKLVVVVAAVQIVLGTVWVQRDVIAGWVLAATANMGLDLPTPGVTSGPEYAEKLKTALETVDAHDHTSGKGVAVPIAGLNINADLDMNVSGTARAVKDATYYAVVEQASDPAVANSIWSSSDGEFHWRDDDGNDVQITSAGSLNASLVGGIGGDYTSTDAAVEYSDASKSYLFLQDSSPDNLAASGVFGNVDLCEPGTASVNCITHKSPTSLAAAYSVTWPTALPASNVPLALDSSGTLSTSFTKAKTASVPPTLCTDSTYANAGTAAGFALDATAQESCVFAWTIPTDWDGTAITLKLIWATAAAGSTGEEVVISWFVSVTGDGEVLRDATGDGFSDEDNPIDVSAKSSNELTVTTLLELDDTDLRIGNLTAGDILSVNVQRDAGEAADDYPSTITPHALVFEYTEASP